MSYENDSKKIESFLLESAKMTRDIVDTPRSIDNSVSISKISENTNT